MSEISEFDKDIRESFSGMEIRFSNPTNPPKGSAFMSVNMDGKIHHLPLWLRHARTKEQARKAISTINSAIKNSGVYGVMDRTQIVTHKSLLLVDTASIAFRVLEVSTQGVIIEWLHPTLKLPKDFSVGFMVNKDVESTVVAHLKRGDDNEL